MDIPRMCVCNGGNLYVIIKHVGDQQEQPCGDVEMCACVCMCVLYSLCVNVLVDAACLCTCFAVCTACPRQHIRVLPPKNRVLTMEDMAAHWSHSICSAPNAGLVLITQERDVCLLDAVHMQDTVAARMAAGVCGVVH